MVAPIAPQQSKNEQLKQADPTLGGRIAETLADPALDRFTDDDEQFLKFHGIYQQDDRDKRKTGKRYMFMIRARIPGGVVPASQYLAFDELAARNGYDALRITSRQSFQWHGVVKSRLGPLMRGLNESLATTIAACGDVNRNVMAPTEPGASPLSARVLADAALISDSLKPTTPAYHQIWVDGAPLKLSDEEKRDFVDPIYGRTYLPRKFKVAFAIPPTNDTDIFTNCLGFVAIADPADPSRLAGYNVLAGGGLGSSHGNKETFPRLADVLGFIEPDRLVDAARAVITAYRDHGDRTNRKHARLKYLVAERGPEWFRAEVEARGGFTFAPARPSSFTRQGDRFGWRESGDGTIHLGLYIETGSVRDVPGRELKTALRKVVSQFGAEVRLTPAQNLILAGIAPENREAISGILAEHGIPVENQAAAVRRASMACPALPTCGLALAESERVFPGVLDGIEKSLASLGLGDAELIVRMTGCPNGCARPHLAEIGFVGRAPGKYNLYLGGNEGSSRLNREYLAGVPYERVVPEVHALLSRWKDERLGNERFGDFASRVIWPEKLAGSAATGAPITA